MTTIEEKLKPIIGFEGKYLISNYGYVYSIKNQLKLYGSNKNGGYKVVKLKNKEYRIHRLVAAYFIMKPRDRNEVNHIDFNKANNHVSNLEWVNGKENMFHYYNNRIKGWNGARDKSKILVKFKGGFESLQNRPVKQYYRDGTFIATYTNTKEASIQTKIPFGTIYGSLQGKASRRYIWRYGDRSEYVCDIPEENLPEVSFEWREKNFHWCRHFDKLMIKKKGAVLLKKAC